MEMKKCSLDLLLVPLSVFINASYHFYLWQSFRAKQPKTGVAANFARRRRWIQSITPADDDKAFLAVQTSRNSLMAAVLSASVAVVVNAALASLANNAYSSRRLLAGHPPFGSLTGEMLALKYASASLLLLVSFLCNSMAVGCIVEASFLLHAGGGEALAAHGEEMMARGAGLAAVGNRVLYVGLSLLLWMLGPVALVFSTVAMVWVFYILDFTEVRVRAGGVKDLEVEGTQSIFYIEEK